MDDTGKISEEIAKKNARKVFEEGDENLSKVDDLIHTCMKGNDVEIIELNIIGITRLKQVKT